MIVNKEDREDIEIDNIGFEETAVDMTIDTSDMAGIYEMFSTNLYKDPISSIVRELVSNCFDAQKANGSEEPVIISGGYEENDFFIYFKDSGEGISPERWTNTLAKFLKSSKKASNDYHGFWGLGSKSPFAYTDLYYFQTVYEGTEYLYIMFKSDTGIPRGDLLSEKKTSKPNGTTVKFSIGEKGYRHYSDNSYTKPSDYNKFEDAINEQLSYFDNVYVERFTFNNEYKIFEGKTYKYRLDSKESEMHLVLGKVKYPIDWKILGRDRINIPVAVKFNIGDLMVVPSREDLKYTVETKENLNKGIDACIKELKEYLDKGYNTIEEVFSQKTGNRTINVAEGVTIPFMTGNYGYDKDLNTIKFPFPVLEPQLKEFVGTPIRLPDNPYFLFGVRSIISNGRIKEKDSHAGLNLWSYTHPEKGLHLPLYRTSDFVSNKHKNFDINNAYIVGKRHLSLKTIMSIIGLMETGITPFREKDRGKKIVGIPMVGDFGNGIHNKIQLAKYYKKVITNIFVKNTHSYDKHPVTLDVIFKYKEKFSKPKRTFNKEAGEIFACLGDNLSSPKVKYDLTQFKSKKRSIIVYGDNSQKKALGAIEILLDNYFRKYGYDGGRYYYLVVMVNKTDVKIMESLNEGRKERDLIAYSVNEFISKNKVFIKEATKIKARHITSQITINRNLRIVSPQLEALYKVAEAFNMSNSVSRLMDTTIGIELLNIIEEGGLYNKEVLQELTLLKDISEDLSIFNRIEKYETLEHNHLSFIARVLKSLNYPIDEYYLFQPTEEEQRWMDEWKKLGQYYQDIASLARKGYTNDHKKAGESYKFHLIYKIQKQEEWQSYQVSKKQNKLGKTLSLLLQEKNLSQ